MQIPFIGKRKKDEEENYSEVKDLKTAHKRSRGEPSRPWGKKERLIVFSVLFATVLTSAVGGLSARNWKLPGIPKLKLPRLTLPDLGGVFTQTIIVEKNGELALSNSKSSEIVSGVSELTTNLSGVYAFYLIDLSSGYTFGLNQKEQMQAASLIKLPAMALFYKQSESGKISMNTSYSLRQEDKVGGSGSLYTKKVGEKLTYEDLVCYMGKQSDNTAFNIARNIVGDSQIQDFIYETGLSDTSLIENTTTPVDVGVFFQKLWEGKLISNSSRDKVLDCLTKTIYEDYLPKNIDDSVNVPHKYGREIHVINDAGLILTEKPFVLVIMTDGIVDEEAESALPKIISLIYTKWVSDGN